MIRPFLTFEGVEGCGKTTQLRRCADYLRARGAAVLTTREPGGTRLGESIRNLLLDRGTGGISTEAEFLLFSASRAEHLHEVVRPALAAGEVVLCDRFFDASVAYQGVARGLGPEKVLDISLKIVGEAIPWRTFWLDLEPKEALSRARERQALTLPDMDRFELEALAFHESVREGYVWSMARDPQRIVAISALGTAEQVFSRLIPHLDELLRKLGRAT